MFELTSPGQERGRLVPTGAARDKAIGETRWDCVMRWRVIYNPETGEVRPMDCKRWSCVEHGPKLAWRWRQRVSGVPWTLMLTLTAVPDDRGAASAAWQQMGRWLRARGMRTYMRVMELGGLHGMRHWHILVDASWIDQRELSVYASLCGLGEVVWVSRVRDRGKAIWYLLGYVFKSLGVEDEKTRGWRKLTVSRNILNWERTLAYRADVREDSDPGHWVVASSPDGVVRDSLTGKEVIYGGVRALGGQAAFALLWRRGDEAEESCTCFAGEDVEPGRAGDGGQRDGWLHCPVHSGTDAIAPGGSSTGDAGVDGGATGD